MISLAIRKNPFISLVLIWVFLFCCFKPSQTKCQSGCTLALASYHVLEGSTLEQISSIFGQEVKRILQYNPKISNKDNILSGSSLHLPFPCDCLNGGDFLGHRFSYSTQPNDSYFHVARFVFANLTTEYWLQNMNLNKPSPLSPNTSIDVVVNCSCGDAHDSTDYGLFETYPLRPGDNLSFLSTESGIPAYLLQMYNPTSNFTAGVGLVFVPAKGLAKGLIVGLSVGGIVVGLSVAVGLYFVFCRKKKVVEISNFDHHPDLLPQPGPENYEEKGSEFADVGGISVMERSVEFSYQELAMATNGFSLDTKIGQGGFASVFYALLKGQKAAIKKMDIQASKEFLAELNVLTHVHHLNLVRLIGYCVEGSLFLVYEYVENGNLSQHLHGRVTGKDMLSWSTRMQIALDSARGLEYIHEHTVPVYIHRDIKSANILLDENFRAKVADFGLAKLTEYGSSSIQSRLVGTFGYMSPEYAQYGDVSPKIDVYAFGVVLYELISAKQAIVKANDSIAESKGLVALFEDVLNRSDPENLRKLIDPNLNDDYQLDMIRKMAQLAKACTHENPQLRPSMRSIVVALMTLMSSNEDWDVSSFYENQGLITTLALGR